MRSLNYAIVNMAMLYSGRISGALVAFMFLPLYARTLGPEQFGIIAVILSLQALLVMMDLGMSTVVGREVAIAPTKNDGATLKLVRTAEAGLTAFYTLALLAIIPAWLFGLFTNVSMITLLGIIILFWSLVLQNLYYSALIAHKSYLSASLIQIAGIGVRACFTGYILVFVSATLDAFVISQLIGGIIHGLVTRYFCAVKLKGEDTSSRFGARPSAADISKLVSMGKSLMLFSAAGAAVTQLDKPIVSSLVSAASVTPYYLAGVLCMTPISLLAGPVSQYFQPIFFRFSGEGNRRSALKTILTFVVVISLVTLVPTIILWWWRDEVISLWLSENTSAPLVADYVKVLLPGFAIGALGFIPYSLLLYAKDFRFMATMSVCMTLATLTFTFFAATTNNVAAVCIIYSLYHGCSTIFSWSRAFALPDVKEYAWKSALAAMLLCVIFLLSIAVINIFI